MTWICLGVLTTVHRCLYFEIVCWALNSIYYPVALLSPLSRSHHSTIDVTTFATWIIPFSLTTANFFSLCSHLKGMRNTHAHDPRATKSTRVHHLEPNTAVCDVHPPHPSWCRLFLIPFVSFYGAAATGQHNECVLYFELKYPCSDLLKRIRR